jgi:hypothetical protein
VYITGNGKLFKLLLNYFDIGTINPYLNNNCSQRIVKVAGCKAMIAGIA